MNALVGPRQAGVEGRSRASPPPTCLGVGVLSIAKLTLPRVAYLEEKNLDRSAAFDRAAYYQAGSLGEWFGRGADLLGLRGAAVEPGQLGRLVEGEHPETGDRLRRRVRRRTQRVEV